MIGHFYVKSIAGTLVVVFGLLTIGGISTGAMAGGAGKDGGESLVLVRSEVDDDVESVAGGGTEGSTGGLVTSEVADAERGRWLFNQCRSCHNLTAGARPLLGPNLYGLFGRKAGSQGNFRRYSRALKEADFEWTAARLDEWLKSPKVFLPGNRMNYAGIKKAQDRADLIAFLKITTAPDGD